MTKLSAAEKSRTYNELAEVTSPTTAEVIMQSVIDVPWDALVTNDHLDAKMSHVDARFAQVDARFAQVDARFAEMNERVNTGFAEVNAKIDTSIAALLAQQERSMRNLLVWLMSAIFTFNGLLAAWLTAVH